MRLLGATAGAGRGEGEVGAGGGIRTGSDGTTDEVRSEGVRE